MLYVTGDLHGDVKRFDKLQMRRLKKGDTLLVCGDFGFIWDNGESEQRGLEKLSKKRYTIAFVDGVHENFDLLDSYPLETWNDGIIRRITPNIVYLMRGEIYEIEGRKIFAFGGGENIYEPFSEERPTWWTRVLPSLDEMKHGAANLEKHNQTVDYILTHSPCPGILSYAQKKNKSILDLYFEELEKRTRFKKWFFGSLHLNRHYTARCEGVFDAILPLD